MARIQGCPREESLLTVVGRTGKVSVPRSHRFLS